MPWNVDKQHTRDRIVNAAQGLLAGQGHLKTTIADIWREAGLSEATPYEYFSGIEALLLIPNLCLTENLQSSAPARPE